MCARYVEISLTTITIESRYRDLALNLCRVCIEISRKCGPKSAPVSSQILNEVHMQAQTVKQSNMISEKYTYGCNHKPKKVPYVIKGE